MKKTQTGKSVAELRDGLKKHGITYRTIEAVSGYSYSLVRKVLVDESRTSGPGYEKIKKVANTMVEAMESVPEKVAA